MLALSMVSPALENAGSVEGLQKNWITLKTGLPYLEIIVLKLGASLVS